MHINSSPKNPGMMGSKVIKLAPHRQHSHPWSRNTATKA